MNKRLRFQRIKLSENNIIEIVFFFCRLSRIYEQKKVFPPFVSFVFERFDWNRQTLSITIQFYHGLSLSVSRIK